MNIHIDTIKHYIDSAYLDLDDISKIVPIKIWLKGIKDPTFEELCILAKILNMPTGLLLVDKTVCINNKRYKHKTSWESVDEMVCEYNNNEVLGVEDYIVNIDNLNRSNKLIQNIYNRIPVPIIQCVAYRNSYDYHRVVIQNGWIIASIMRYVESNKFKELDSKIKRIFNSAIITYIEYDSNQIEDEIDIEELERVIHYDLIT